MKHILQVLNIGKAPSAICVCGQWGYVMSRTKGDNDSSICWALETAHRQHVQDTKPKRKGKQIP